MRTQAGELTKGAEVWRGDAWWTVDDARIERPGLSSEVVRVRARNPKDDTLYEFTMPADMPVVVVGDDPAPGGGTDLDELLAQRPVTVRCPHCSGDVVLQLKAP